jgi:hypothetical protein
MSSTVGSVVSREPLSLATFQPSYAQEPYLNTPRSLRACEILGIQPIDLVEIPFREYRKAYPNDEEAALRRFERMDGVRKSIFEAVKVEWQRLVDRGMRRDRSKSPKRIGETIIECEPEAHTTLLEIQAEKLHKIEQQQWLTMKKMITLELKAAIADEKGKQIMGKQDQIQKQNDFQKKERLRLREELLRSQREEAKQKEIAQAKLVRLEQQRMGELAEEMKLKKKDDIKKERLRQKEREDERLQNEAFFKRQKDDQKAKFDADANAKLNKIAHENKIKADRAADERARKEEEMAKEQKLLADKIEKARRDQQYNDENRRKQVASLSL